MLKNQTGNSLELFPINIFDKIPENHLVRLADMVVNSLDITDILKKYKGGGCPMGQRMENIGQGKRISSNGYEFQVTYYQTKNLRFCVKRCDGCPLRSFCHQAKENRSK